MIETSVADLKARLSHFLRLARNGETVKVQSHGHPVAKLVPISDADLVIPASRPVSDIRYLPGIAIEPGADSVTLLLEDRKRR